MFDRGPLMAVLLLVIPLSTTSRCVAQEMFDFVEPPADTSHPIQLLRQLQQAARPLQPLGQAVQAIVALMRQQEELARQRGVPAQSQQIQQMRLLIDFRIKNLLQGPEMTSGLGLVREYRTVIERSLGNVDGYCEKYVNRDAMLAIPLSQRQRDLRSLALLWSEDSAWIGMLLDAFRAITNQYGAAPPTWLLDSLQKIQDRRVSELERIARFLEYSKRMQEEYDGGFAEQERRLLPRTSSDIAGKLFELYKNDGLQPHQSPRDAYELYVYLESLAALAKLYLKTGNYAGALQALRMSHLTDARDTFDQGNLRLLIEIDRLLQMGLRESETLLSRIRGREAMETNNWVQRKNTGDENAPTGPRERMAAGGGGVPRKAGGGQLPGELDPGPDRHPGRPAS